MKQGIGHEIFRIAVCVAEIFRTAVRLPVRGFLGTEPLGNPTLGLRECFRLLGSPTSPYSTASASSEFVSDRLTPPVGSSTSWTSSAIMGQSSCTPFASPEGGRGGQSFILRPSTCNNGPRLDGHNMYAYDYVYLTSTRLHHIPSVEALQHTRCSSMLQLHQYSRYAAEYFFSREFC